MTRRRRIFLETLEQKKPPSGREVVDPRTPKSLHPTPTATTLASPPPATRSSTGSAAARSRGGRTAHGEPRGPRTRGSRLLDGEAPESADTGEEEDDAKTPTTDASASKTSPGSTLLKPTLYTPRDPGFPHPPAAGAAGGGKGNQRIAAGEVV